MEVSAVTVVTGGNRGLGREVCRQLAARGHTVVLTARDATKGEEAAEALRAEGGDVRFFPLDVTDDRSVAALAGWLAADFGRLDVLVNNAGIVPDRGFEDGVEGTETEVLRRAMETNLYGPHRMIRALLPLLRGSAHARIVNVSTGMAGLEEMGAGVPAYRVSKTALNALTRVTAVETAKDKILVNAVCPGWVRTEMGGAGANREIPEGAASIVWAATLPEGGPSGGFFRDGQPLPW